MPSQGYILHQNSESVDMKASQFLKSYTWCAAAAAIDSILENLEVGARARKIDKLHGTRRVLHLQGVVQNIIHLCSFENLSNLGVKATGMYHKAVSLILQCKRSRSSG
ncbi:hypothetical protein OIU76_025397 [Salix suchowensis]|nr:hypothetical protein OIU76_025397 [Salix suchowensis]